MAKEVGERERGRMGVCVREKVWDGRECESVREQGWKRESDSRGWERERERDNRW